jgi:hypothetical protein
MRHTLTPQPALASRPLLPVIVGVVAKRVAFCSCAPHKFTGGCAPDRTRLFPLASSAPIGHAASDSINAAPTSVVARRGMEQVLTIPLPNWWALGVYPALCRARHNRPISARYPALLSLRASERILVNRLESRSRRRRGRAVWGPPEHLDGVLGEQ